MSWWRSKFRLFDWQIILSLTIDSQTCVLGLNWVSRGTLNSVLTFSYINGFALLHMPILLYPFLTSLLCSKGLVDLGAPCPLEDVLARYVCVQIGGHPLEMTLPPACPLPPNRGHGGAPSKNTLPPSGGFNFFVKNYGQYWPTTSININSLGNIKNELGSIPNVN
mgnify:CR=1 FL=1